MRPILLPIDLQKDFRAKFALLKPPGRFDDDVTALLRFFRERRLPILHLHTIHKRDGSTWTLHMKRGGFRICMEGTEGVEELDAAKRLPAEPVIYKTRWSAFFGTDLGERLRDGGYDTLVLAGFLSHACIRVTAIDAYQRDYDVIIARDCVDSYDALHERITFDYLSRYAARIMSNDELFRFLGGS